MAFSGAFRAPFAKTFDARAAAVGNGLLNNLVAYWKLDEAAGANNALDAHTNGLTFTQVGSPGSATGIVYAGARVTASGKYFNRTSEALLQAGDVDFSIAAWVYRTTADGNTAVVIGKDNSTAGGRDYVVYYAGANKPLLQVHKATDSAVFAMAADVPSLNAWHLLIAWHDSVNDTVNFSVDNGTPVSTATGGPLQTAGAAKAGIGNRERDNYIAPFLGRIGPVAMWKSAAGAGGVLSAAQRTTLWNAGAGLAYAAFTT